MPQILIIDDDKGLRLIIRQALERVGHTVEEASNGIEGMKLYRARPADLVIVDLVMPDKEGLETIMELRRANPDAVIIAISGGGSVAPEDYLQIARKLGARYTLAKPFTAAKMHEAVNSALSA